MNTDFELRYQSAGDPWDVRTSAYELAKRRQTVEACGPGRFARVCELGCGLGLLAADLAPRCDWLLAIDGAPTAVAAARDRLAGWEHVRVECAEIPEGLPPTADEFDLVVASELLYYLDDDTLARTIGWIQAALVPAGRVVSVLWTGSAPDLLQSADSVGSVLRAASGLRAAPAPLGTGYRIDVLERRA